jgi:hypothetical protein
MRDENRIDMNIQFKVNSCGEETVANMKRASASVEGFNNRLIP